MEKTEVQTTTPVPPQLRALHEAGIHHVVTTSCPKCGLAVYGQFDRPTAQCPDCATLVDMRDAETHSAR